MSWEERFEAYCPFYMGEKVQRIQCEGFNEDNRVQLVFRDELNKAGWQMDYCYTFHYPECPLAKTLNGKYEPSHRGGLHSEEKCDTIASRSAAGTSSRP